GHGCGTTLDNNCSCRPSFIERVLDSLTTKHAKKEDLTWKPRHRNRGLVGPATSPTTFVGMQARLPAGLGRIIGVALPGLFPSDL
ncbi:MAG: hypothetical protein J2P36_18750, partial [Ktedonobacteraceae bacterium]|nr:hypothetical protein [Ktedonobacteraceae bacterium]